MSEVLVSDVPGTLEPIGSDIHGLRLIWLSSLLEDWQTEAEAAHEAYTSGSLRGPVTGFAKVDSELGGAFPPGLHILHGQPGAGKTAFVLQVAATCGFPALLVTCEMGPLELLRRVTARVTGTFLGRLKSGELSPKESLSLVERAIATAPDLVIADATREYAGPTWILAAAEQVRKSSRNLLIVMDSIHSWVDSAQTKVTEYEALNAGLAALRGLAHRGDCPILAVAERNRASMKAGGQSAGAGTRKIEYGAETVLDLGRDPEDRPDANGEVPVTLIFAKNRNGAAGKKVPLVFHGALQRFKEA